MHAHCASMHVYACMWVCAQARMYECMRCMGAVCVTKHCSFVLARAQACTLELQWLAYFTVPVHICIRAVHTCFYVCTRKDTKANVDIYRP